MSKGARSRRRERREKKLGKLVAVVSTHDNLEIFSCGHETPKGPARQHGPGEIRRHCLQCN